VRLGHLALLLFLGLGGLTACSEDDAPASDRFDLPTDISGLAWLGAEPGVAGDAAGQLFLAAHDAKAKDGERERTRVSILRSATDESGVQWQQLTELEFPVRGLSNDLESVARIPGRSAVLLVESGDGGDKPGATSSDAEAGIYVAEYEFVDGSVDVELVSYTPWPTTPAPLDNVEATAVALAGEQLWFLYAERANGQDTTTISWTTLDLAEDGSLTFGREWRSAPFTRPGPVDARPASSLEVGPDGAVYVASAWDPDSDDGPYESAVWLVGTWNAVSAEIELLPEPAEVARSDGFKIEAVAVAGDDGSAPVYVGVDDEDYGGIIRPLRPR
jgi:hypothetical protein